MNWLLPALTAFVLAVALFRSLVDWLNVKHAKAAPAPESVTAEKFAETLSYLEAQTRFGIFQRLFTTTVTLGFLWAGGFALVDEFARARPGNPIWAGLIFFAIIGVLSEILSLPFSYYSTFVLEERFGFNRSSLKTFLGDQLKGLLLAVVIGGPILAALIFFFLSAGVYAWVWAAVFVSVMQLILGFLAPVVLMPLFNKFTPLPEGELKSEIEKYASTVNFKLQGIFTMDGSKRSKKANAFFTGLGRFRRIVLFDTLIEQHSVKELVAVLAHEVGHFKLGHIVKSLALSIVSSFALFYFLGLVIRSPEISAAFGFSTPTVHGGLTAAVWLYGPVSLLMGIGLSALSRKHEYEADAYAARTTGRPADLAAALQRLSAENLSNPSPHPWKVWLEYSHPPVSMRVEALAKSMT